MKKLRKDITDKAQLRRTNMTEQEFWNEMFEIEQDLKNQGFHK